MPPPGRMPGFLRLGIMHKPIRYRLEAADTSGSVRVLTGLHVSLGEGKRSSTVTIIRTGSFNHPKYGRFEVSRELLDGMVRNFKQRTYGQDIFIDVGHEPEKGAAGEIKRLFVEGNRLRAQVEWTEYGVQAIQERGFRYLSADYWDDWQDNEQGERHGPLLAGAGLVTRPHIKRLDPVQLAEAADGIPTLLHPELSKTLSKEAQKIMNEFLKTLREALEAKKLSDQAVESLLSAFTASAKNLGEDEDALKSLCDQFIAAGDEIAKTLAEGPGGTVKIDIQAPAAKPDGKQLSEEDVKRLLEEDRKAVAQTAKQLQERQDANLKILSDTLAAQEGFSDELKKELTDGVQDLITPDMSEDQVRRLAENQVALGNRIAATARLAAMGYQTGGAAGSAVAGQHDVDLARRLGYRVAGLVPATSDCAGHHLFSFNILPNC